MKKVKIIVMAKAPVAGFAKTRLIPALGAEGAAALAQQLLRNTLHHVQAVSADAIELCVTPGLDQPEWSTLHLGINIPWALQGDGDLGARLARTCQRAILQGYAVIVMGTDCPSLTADIIQQAVRALKNNHAVIIPATDGGYTLLGFTEFDASLFTDIQWSTNTVFQETLQRIHALQWRVEILDALHDIDEPDDLRWLPDTWKPALQIIGNIDLY